MANDLISFYSTPVPNDDSCFLIHTTENEGRTLLNYCPKNKDAVNSIRASIPFHISLMPFVPRSIITKFDNPVCAAEITGNGTSKYTTNIHLIDEPENMNIFAYPINKETIFHENS